MKSVMVIDDDDDLRTSIAGVLKAKDYNVLHAKDGHQALHIIEGSAPDFIISDIRMPGMDGTELLQKLNHQKCTSKIILMSAFSDVINTQKAYSMGAVDFLLKPFQAKDLLLSLEIAGNLIEEHGCDTVESKFCAINSAEFVSGKKALTDLFLRLSESKFILIAREDTYLDEDRLSVYRNKGLQFFYVRKEDFHKYTDLSIKVARAAANSTLSTEKKFTILKHTAEVVIQDLFDDAIERPKFEAAKAIVNSTTNMLSRDPNIVELLDLLKNHSNGLYSHSVAVSLFSSLIGREIGLASTNVQTKLSLGGLFHDIGKKEIPKEILKKLRSLWTAEESDEYESHTIKGQEILASIPWMPNDVIQICLHHHENASGNGFPLGLSKLRIHPLALIVSVANEFCNHIAGNKDLAEKNPLEAIEFLAENCVDILDAKAFYGLMSLYSYPAPDTVLRRVASIPKGFEKYE